MEFRARYVLAGIVTLAVLLAGFFFVYWLERPGGLDRQSEFMVRFTVPISGIAKGSSVLFNGVKVGEVSAIQFSNDNPGHLLARISISDIAPVREDTSVGIEYQGLTGAANILLVGGTAQSPRLTSKDGLSELVADPEMSRSWTQNAGRLMVRIDKIFADNKDRFGAILAGLERMTGGGSGTAGFRLYNLPAPSTDKPAGQAPQWRLVISEPSVVLALNTDKILTDVGTDMWEPYENLRWTDNLPNLVQTKLIQGFENFGYADAIIRPEAALDQEYKLAIDIRRFHLNLTGQPTMNLEMMARLTNPDGNVIRSQLFTISMEQAGKDAEEIAQGLGRAFSTLGSQIINWTVSAL